MKQHIKLLRRTLQESRNVRSGKTYCDAPDAMTCKGGVAGAALDAALRPYEHQRRVVVCKRSAIALWFVLATFVIGAPHPVAAEINASPVGSPAPLLKAGVVESPAPSRTLSLSACFDRADLYNKEIVSAKWNLPIAKAGIRIAGAIPNPQFELQEGFGPSFSLLFTGQTEQIGWTQQFLTAGKRSKKMELARANYALAELQLDALRFDVHNRVRRAYAEQAAAEAYAELIEAQRAVGLKLLAIAEKRFNAGKAPQSEVLQAKLNVSQFDTQRNQAQIRLQQDSAALALIIGDKPEHVEVIDVDDNGLFKLSQEKTEVVPSPIGALPPLQQLSATAYSSRPDLKAAQQQVFVNRKALTLARAQRIPDLFVGAGYTFAAFAKHQPAGLAPQPNWVGNGVFVNVSAENPIFYQHQGEVLQAIGNLRQAERKADLLKCQVATDVVTAYNEVSVARANIFVFQKNLLPTAADVARLARRGYEVGKTDLATAIVAQQQYQQTLSNYFDAVVAYQISWADLEKAVGVALR
jgi:cobalt-zinc-cadmium efflux system outer membrane protein